MTVFAKTVIDCGAGVPGDQWTCDADGKAKPADDSACGTEGTALQQCWFEGPSSGLPDMTDDCKAYCNNLKGLDCAPAGDCESECLQRVSDGLGTQKACRGAYAALIHCSATKMTADDFECDDENDIQAKSNVCDDAMMTIMACAMDYCDKNKDDPDCQQ